jgi:hypothetical protein
MSTVRSMLPVQLQPYTEEVVGAALGALIGGYVLKQKASTGAIVGALCGYGLSLTKAKGAFPFRASGNFYTGEDAVAPGSQAAQEILDVEEAIPAPLPQWPYGGYGRGWDRRGWGGGFGRGFGGRGFGGHFGRR